MSSFDEGPLVKIHGIPRATGRSPVNPDICYLIKIPVGARGTTETLEKMAGMIIEASQDAGFVQEARACVRECPPRNPRCEGQAIYDWTKDDVVIYRNDPTFMEYIQSPGFTLFVDGQEDCDGSSSFVGACDTSIGRACRLAAYGLDPEKAKDKEYSHVLCELGIREPNGGVLWLGQDTVAGRGFGWRPPEREWLLEPNYLVVASP